MLKISIAEQNFDIFPVLFDRRVYRYASKTRYMILVALFDGQVTFIRFQGILKGAPLTESGGSFAKSCGGIIYTGNMNY